SNKESSSTTASGTTLSLSKLDRMNIQTLIHDYRAHTWEKEEMLEKAEQSG
ncbi:unnamed protein product, partial [Amoebophrya sp. A120]